MARKFTPGEKEQIAMKLQEEGKRLFELFGLHKTTVSDLTKSVGIAQGTFYQFYASKEALYFNIVEQEEENVRTFLLNEELTSKRLTKRVFQGFLHQCVEILEERPILRQLYNENVMEQLLLKLPPETFELNNKKDVADLVPFIEHWQAEGMMKNIDPQIVVSMIRSLIILALQRKLIGELYDQTIDQFVYAIADRLIIEELSEK